MALVTSRTHRHISDQLLQSDRATRGHGAPAGSPPAPSGRAPKQEAMAEAPSLPIPGSWDHRLWPALRRPQRASLARQQDHQPHGEGSGRGCAQEMGIPICAGCRGEAFCRGRGGLQECPWTDRWSGCQQTGRGRVGPLNPNGPGGRAQGPPGPARADLLVFHCRGP